jgi:hypothetical protein
VGDNFGSAVDSNLGRKRRAIGVAMFEILQ